MGGGNIATDKTSPSSKSVSVSASFFDVDLTTSPSIKRRFSRKRRMGIPSRVLRIWRSQNYKILGRVINRREQKYVPAAMCSETRTATQPGRGTLHENGSYFLHLPNNDITNTNGTGISLTAAFHSEKQSTFPSNSVHSSRSVMAIDCEMVGTGPKGSSNALGRCSIVDYNGKIVFDKYIQPLEPITDFRTPWSGITPKHMEQAIPFFEAQAKIAAILEGNVIIGHAIWNDFRVLKIHHPPEHIRDTSKYHGLRSLANVSKKGNVGLKKLIWILKRRKIQEGPHCSVEDARASMDLYRIVEHQWEEEMYSLFPDKDYRLSFMDDHFWPEEY